MRPIELTEKEKYEAVWNMQAYRLQCDGEPVADFAYVSMGCAMGESIIDWGCGTGRCAAAFRRFGMNAIGFDIAKNCLDPNITTVPLIVGTIWEPPQELPITDYAFCTDVMEHIPEEKVEVALDAIFARTRYAAFIQVDTVVDTFGNRMNPPRRLHLTVKPQEWWQEQLEKRSQQVTVSNGAATRVNFLCKILSI